MEFIMKTFNVIYDSSAILDDLKSQLTSVGCEVVEVLEALNIIHLKSDTDAFKDLSGIVAWEEDLSVIANAEYYWHQLRLSKQELPLQETITYKNNAENQVIYMVDSGIKLDCPELSNATAENRIVNLYSHDGDFSDPTGHGTGLTSLIVGNTVGVSVGAIVKNVKIPMGNQTTILELLKAFNAVLEDHNQSPTVVKVVNCSWTVPKSSTLDTKITELKDRGLIVVAAAGNNKIDADTLSPVGLNSVIGVGAMDVFDRVIDWGENIGSNWGEEVDLFAPGIDVTISNLDGDLVQVSGTSLSAAITSAVVAQYIKQYPLLLAADIQNLVISSAVTDVLFRNETIYGGTPNRLLITLFYDDLHVWEPPRHTTLPVKQGTIQTIDINVESPPITNVTYGDIEWVSEPSRIKASAWPWVSLNKEGDLYKLTVDASNLDLGKYMVFLEGISNDVPVYRGIYKVGVYEEDVTELDSEDMDEVYEYVDSDGSTVIVISQFCFSPSDCPKGTSCIDNTCGF